MRTFISDKLRAIIDVDSSLIDTYVRERRLSISGGSLNILGRISAKI